MNKPNHLQRIEALAETYIADKKKYDFVQMHGKIALSIFNTLKPHLNSRFGTEADQCVRILEIFDSDAITDEDIDLISSFFSSMILAHSKLHQKKKTSAQSRSIPPIMGLIVFAMASIFIWAFSFLTTFGIENSTSMIILIAVVGFVLLLKGKSVFGLGGDA